MEIGPGADLVGVNLEGRNLEWIDLEGANLQRANLRNAILYYANLLNADLRGADLRGANCRKALMVGVQLDQALLDGADFRGAVYTWQGNEVGFGSRGSTSDANSLSSGADFKKIEVTPRKVVRLTWRMTFTKLSILLVFRVRRWFGLGRRQF